MGTCSGEVTVDTWNEILRRDDIAYEIIITILTVIGLGGAAYLLCCRKDDDQRRKGGCWVKGMSIGIVLTLVFFQAGNITFYFALYNAREGELTEKDYIVFNTFYALS